MMVNDVERVGDHPQHADEDSQSLSSLTRSNERPRCTLNERSTWEEIDRLRRGDAFHIATFKMEHFDQRDELALELFVLQFA